MGRERKNTAFPDFIVGSIHLEVFSQQYDTHMGRSFANDLLQGRGRQWILEGKTYILNISNFSSLAEFILYFKL
jgi:hypothetical protein